MSLPRSVLPNTTYMLTRRCLGRRFLLRPDGAINNIFVYCLALAAEKYGVELHAACVMSNHYHLILTDVRGVLPDFTAWLNRQLAMCIKRVRKWDEVVWEPNVACSAIELPGRAEVLDKVAYVLLNPVSAALVRSPERWPGVVTTLRTLRRGTMGAKHPEVWFKSKARESATLSFTTPSVFRGPSIVPRRVGVPAGEPSRTGASEGTPAGEGLPRTDAPAQDTGVGAADNQEATIRSKSNVLGADEVSMACGSQASSAPFERPIGRRTRHGEVENGTWSSPQGHGGWHGTPVPSWPRSRSSRVSESAQLGALHGAHKALPRA